MSLYLVPQKTLEELHSQEKIKNIEIVTFDYETDAPSWAPIFNIYIDGKNVECSIRRQAEEDIRRWRDLRLLVKWLYEKFDVEKITVYLGKRNSDGQINSERSV